jgi:hypothetical protein
MAINDIPLSVDYTSRDYYALREELIARVKNRIPDWTATDNADFGVALVEAFAYMGDVANYYVDRIANEAFLATATQRESILAIAETYGYKPAGYGNATLNVTFYNNSGSIVTIPAGTRVTGSVTINDTVQQLTFTTASAGSISAYGSGVRGQADIPCYEGKLNTVEASNTYGVLLGASSGTASQSFELNDFPIVQDSVKVYVKSGNTYKQWTSTLHLLDYGPNDTVYSTRLDGDNNLYVDFGDGISGAIPALNAEIRCVYVVGGGAIGNIPTSTLNSITYVPGLTDSQVASLNGIVDVNNVVVGVSGTEPDSNDLIRAIAPTYLRAQNRAVTLQDFESLALSVSSQVGKAHAVSSGYTSVTLYLAPKRDDNDGDLTPGLDSNGAATVEWTTMRDAVTSYLSDKLLAGTTVTYTIPTYVPVTISLTYTLDPIYTAAVAEKNIKSYLVSNFSYNYIPFGANVTAQDIEYVLQQVPGVKKASLQLLYKTGGTPSLTALTALDNEILQFSETNLIVAPA